jgi:sulfur carrier protein
MEIFVNGANHNVLSGMTLQQLLEELELAEGRIAVEINGSIISRGELSSHTLNEGDRIEIVQAIGGG